MHRGLGRLGGPPLIVQLIGLLVGALIAAQLVTLLLTLVLPPPPPRAYRLDDIAAALAGTARDDDRFTRAIERNAPDLSAPGWFVSTRARTRLASLLHRPVDAVALGFFTQLPVGGTVGPIGPPPSPRDGGGTTGGSPPIADARPAGMLPADGASLGGLLPTESIEIAFSGGGARMMEATWIQQRGGPGGGMPAGGAQGSSFPGGGPRGDGFPGARFPGGFPQSAPQSASQSMRDPASQRQQPQQPVAMRQGQTLSPRFDGGTPEVARGPVRGSAGPAAPLGATPASPTGGGARTPNGDGFVPRFGASDRIYLPQAAAPRPTVRAPESLYAPAPHEGRSMTPAAGAPVARTVAPSTVASGSARRIAPPPAAIAPATPTASSSVAAISGGPLPVSHTVMGLFGLAPAPFVEGDFVAAARLTDGRWAVVSPRPDSFPSAWQRRVGLWFLLSLLAVAPVAWLFARRIVGPLNEFAHAADTLGRDPGAAVLPLRGPAEIGRAAHAFNQMQSRLRSFVDDRTAMVGAISHDLRTPLTRLRFRIEDVPDDLQDGLRGEVDEMEAMISSVIAFLRDASVPNARERRDLAEIVDDVVENAAILGNVHAERMDSAIVDIDALGIRRVLDNLLTNAIKYGDGQARVVLRVENERAVADIVDPGPGVPDGELERIFEPFYRSEAARRSGREGSGLGLAVCRSIARAHGGDVALFRSPAGFTARMTLPLAFAHERRAA